MLPIRTILHLTDSSKNAGLALSLACSLAGEHNARLFVLSLAQPSTLVAYEFPEASLLREPAFDQLADDLRPLNDRRHRTHAARHLSGPEDLATQIVLLAKKWNCDLIIIGMEGSSSGIHVRDLTEELLQSANCPVLTARCPQRKRRQPFSRQPLAVAEIW